MRNEMEARTMPGMSGQRSNNMSMRYDPTMRSNTSMMSHNEPPSPAMMLQETGPSFG